MGKRESIYLNIISLFLVYKSKVKVLVFIYFHINSFLLELDLISAQIE